MPKIKYDLRDVDSAGGFDVPPVGLYRATLVECNLKESKKGNEMLECVYELSAGDYKGSRVWDYLVLQEGFAERKLKQFLEAVEKIKGKRGAKGAFDPDEFEDAEVQLRLKHETYEDEPRARVAAVLPMPEEDEDEEEVDDDEDAEDDGDEGSGEEYTYEDLEGMDLKELKEVIDEEELEIRVTKKSKVETVLGKVAEALELEPEEEEEEEEEEEGDDDETYEDMTPAELKAECKDRGLKAAGKKSVLIARLEKDDEEAEDPFE
jgi:hypothetical protein